MADVDDLSMKIGGKMATLRATLHGYGPRTRRALGSMLDAFEESLGITLELRRDNDSLRAENESLKAELAKRSIVAVQVNIDEVNVGTGV